MVDFRTPEELELHRHKYGYVTANDRAKLIDRRDGSELLAPADQVQHWLQKCDAAGLPIFLWASEVPGGGSR